MPPPAIAPGSSGRKASAICLWASATSRMARWTRVGRSGGQARMLGVDGRKPADCLGRAWVVGGIDGRPSGVEGGRSGLRLSSSRQPHPRPRAPRPRSIHRRRGLPAAEGRGGPRPTRDRLVAARNTERRACAAAACPARPRLEQSRLQASLWGCPGRARQDRGRNDTGRRLERHRGGEASGWAACDRKSECPEIE